MVALATHAPRTQERATQAKPVRLPPRKPLPFPGPAPLPPAARSNLFEGAHLALVGVLYTRYAEQVRTYAYWKLDTLSCGSHEDLSAGRR